MLKDQEADFFTAGLSFVGGVRERESGALFRAVAHKYKGLILFVLLHQCRVLETLEHGGLPLNSCISNVTNLVTVERSPMLSIVPTVKGEYVSMIDKIDEGITPIAPILEIDR
mmetsp:Transcript_133484/g.198432  ORF Transcript_133484/g.198432 Transcript_133484/m.198432 type:complete len:113 (-) Transcript_133484:993-1331(-)